MHDSQQKKDNKNNQPIGRILERIRGFVIWAGDIGDEVVEMREVERIFDEELKKQKTHSSKGS